MQSDSQVVDLDGYLRLSSVERDLAWSPEAVACTSAAAVGLLVAAIGFAHEFGLVAVPGQGGHAVGTAIVLAGLLFCAVAAGLDRAMQLRLLARLRCPNCGGALVRRVADLGEEEQGRWGERGVCLGGRRYCAPFLGEGDKRSWVRAMKEVRVCVTCQVYVDGSSPHEQACSDDELQLLREHIARRGRSNRAHPVAAPELPH